MSNQRDEKQAESTPRELAWGMVVIAALLIPVWVIVAAVVAVALSAFGLWAALGVVCFSVWAVKGLIRSCVAICKAVHVALDTPRAEPQEIATVGHHLTVS